MLRSSELHQSFFVTAQIWVPRWFRSPSSSSPHTSRDVQSNEPRDHDRNIERSEDPFEYRDRTCEAGRGHDVPPYPKVVRVTRLKHSSTSPTASASAPSGIPENAPGRNRSRTSNKYANPTAAKRYATMAPKIMLVVTDRWRNSSVPTIVIAAPIQVTVIADEPSSNLPSPEIGAAQRPRRVKAESARKGHLPPAREAAK